MNPDSENFDQLRKLLALKKHEQPPPGYFNKFSGDVIVRIKAGDQGEDGLAWVRKLWSVFEAKPMLTGAFGAAICALAISGIVLSDDVDVNASNVRGAAGSLNSMLGGTSEPLAMNPPPGNSQFSSSTNPVSPTLRSLFELPQINALPASGGFSFPGGN